jgi:FMN phosphatase YigB (HAD superfamily)
VAARLEGPIRAVLFDVDGTLYSQPPLRVAMACEMVFARLRGLARSGRSDVSVALAFRKMREELRATDNSKGSLAARQYAAVAVRLGCSEEEVEAAVTRWIYQRPLRWLRRCRRPGVIQVLDGLRARGVRCGVFSDYPAADKLGALGLSTYFDLTLSAVDPEVDAFKPDPRGFQVAADRWALPAREILYVGDRVDVDAVGAQAAGMPCAVLTRQAPTDAVRFLPAANYQELWRVLDRVC